MKFNFLKENEKTECCVPLLEPNLKCLARLWRKLWGLSMAVSTFPDSKSGPWNRTEGLSKQSCDVLLTEIGFVGEMRVGEEKREKEEEKRTSLFGTENV